jgi:hypothetical protein
MTKKAMVNRMVELGIYNETDRNYVMRKYTKEQIEQRYNEYVPFRIAYLKKQGIEVR